MQLKLQNARFGNVMVIRCDGHIVAGEEVQALEAAIERISLETGQIVLNLAQTNFLDSGGLGALVRFTRVLRRNHGDMVLSDLTPFVVHALQATNLHTFFRPARRKRMRCEVSLCVRRLGPPQAPNHLRASFAPTNRPTCWHS